LRRRLCDIADDAVASNDRNNSAIMDIITPFIPQQQLLRQKQLSQGHTAEMRHC